MTWLIANPELEADSLTVAYLKDGTWLTTTMNSLKLVYLNTHNSSLILDSRQILLLWLTWTMKYDLLPILGVGKFTHTVSPVSSFRLAITWLTWRMTRASLLMRDISRKQMRQIAGKLNAESDSNHRAFHQSQHHRMMVKSRGCEERG